MLVAVSSEESLAVAAAKRAWPTDATSPAPAPADLVASRDVVHPPDARRHCPRQSAAKGASRLNAPEIRPTDVFCRWLLRHQLGLSLNLLLLLALTHQAFFRARPVTRRFFQLSYYDEVSGRYAAGWSDACFVGCWVIIITGVRAATMEQVLRPWICWTRWLDSERTRTKFVEQAWMFIHYAISWSIGMHICLRSTYWYDFRELWTDWPNREVDGLTKFYCLAQMAFWLQQLALINVEKRRNDHWPMFSHHVITVSLLFASYSYHQTRVAILIMCTMDLVDLILPVAKCAKYLGLANLANALFAVFMTVWIVSRHMYYVLICYSVWADLPVLVPTACYRGGHADVRGPLSASELTPGVLGAMRRALDPFVDPRGTICWNQGIGRAFLIALLCLQGLAMYWLSLIFRVAFTMCREGAADDVRSDDEDTDDGEHDHDDDAAVGARLATQASDNVRCRDLKEWER